MTDRTKKWGFVESFAYHGAEPKNPRWWTARPPDGLPVVSLWTHQLSREDDVIVTRSDGFMDARGNGAPKDKLTTLIHAIDHCDSRFRVVMCTAKDPDARPRQVKHCYPHPTLVMQITWLDLITGAHEARSVTTGDVL